MCTSALQLDAAKLESGTDFGPGAAFYKLKGLCLESRTAQYT